MGVHISALASRARRAGTAFRRRSVGGAQCLDEAVASSAARRAIAGATSLGGAGGAVDSSDVAGVPVVMCLWDRLDRLPRTLRNLQHALGEHTDIYLWNNQATATDRVLHDVRTAIDRPSGDRSRRITVATSEINVGGFGRFYWARELAERHPYVVFLDDDQMLDAFSFGELTAESAPRSIRGVWAYRFENRTEYWRRSQVDPGERAHYVGTGGMVIDSSIFLVDEVFHCPAPYWFVEDLWLSYFASAKLGWSLRRSRAEVGMIFDGKDQYRALRQRKDDFFRRLARDARWLDTRRLDTDPTAAHEVAVPAPRAGAAVADRLSR